MADLSLINAAATRTGSPTITSLTEGTAVSDVANQNYERVVRAELAAYRWKFATKFGALGLLDQGTPPEPWLYAYQRPSDLIVLRSVMVAGLVVPYSVMGDLIYTDQNSAVEVIGVYTWRVPESLWPAWFAEPIIRRMEAILLRSIGERFAEAAERDAAADGTGRGNLNGSFAAARKMDAQSETPRDPYRYRILEARLA